MTPNIPTFSKRHSPIKSAIISWIDDQFQKSGKEELIFKMGELEDGVRKILKKPELSSASIRGHSCNLIGPPKGVFATEITSSPTQNTKWPQTPYRNRSLRISSKQRDNLLAVQANWEQRYPSLKPEGRQR